MANEEFQTNSAIPVDRGSNILCIYIWHSSVNVISVQCN